MRIRRFQGPRAARLFFYLTLTGPTTGDQNGSTVTLFTGQWADLPIETMARMTHEFGYDGIELACWGDHFEVDQALADDNYVKQKRELLTVTNSNATPSLPTL